MNGTNHVLVLNELSLFRLAGLMLKGRRVFHLDTLPFVPALRGPLDRLLAIFIRRGWVHNLDGLDEGAIAARVRSPLFPSKDWFARTERRFVSELGLERRAPDEAYDYAACKQAINFGAEQLRTIFFLHELKRVSPGLRVTLHGCPGLAADIRFLLDDLGEDIECRPTRHPRRAINAVLTLVTVLRSWLEIVTQTGLRRNKRRKVLLAVDVIDALDRMVPAVNDILDDPGEQGLYVFRNKQACRTLRAGLGAEPTSSFPGGRFGMSDAFAAGGLVLRDCARLYTRFGRVNSRLFLQIVKLAAIRIHFRALFNRYDVSYFWARDEYNAEHIIRAQELRRRGGRSIGLINGVNVFGVDSVYRYIDHDETYVFSPGPFLRYNGDNWKNPEHVRQIGAIGLRRSEIAEMIEVGKSPDIVCFAKTYCDGPEYLDQVFKIARTFPDRNVYVSLKASATRLGGGDEFFEHMKNRPPNVTLTDDPSFELIKKCRYVISGESSILSEAINLGSISFFLDTYPSDETFVYRDYPFLSHSDGDAISRLIAGVEDGSWKYPVESYRDLADLSGRSAFDTLRLAIGLAPKDPPIVKHIWKGSNAIAKAS